MNQEIIDIIKADCEQRIIEHDNKLRADLEIFYADFLALRELRNDAQYADALEDTISGMFKVLGFNVQ